MDDDAAAARVWMTSAKVGASDRGQQHLVLIHRPELCSIE